jgi:hypothetical protein
MALKKYLIGLVFITILANTAQAQTPVLADTIELIAIARANLRKAVRAGDKTQGNTHLKALLSMTSCLHWSLGWDERWLTYHWADQQRALLNELRGYDDIARFIENYCVLPPSDSLFEQLDLTMYQEREQYSLRLADLQFNPEEQTFLNLHLEYLLRNNTEVEQERRALFLKDYPNSKYAEFVRTFMNLPPKPKKQYFSFDVMAFSTNWTNNLDLTLRPGWGFQSALTVHRNRFNFTGKFSASWQNLSKPVYEDTFIWEKSAPSVYNNYGLEFGYNVLNRSKVRIAPALEAGVSKVYAPSDSSQYTDPQTIFNYTSAYLGAGVTFDLKMFPKSTYSKGLKSAPYNGVRVRVGYHRMYLNRQQEDLKGNMLYLAFGFQFSGS